MSTQVTDPIQQEWTIESNSLQLAHTTVEYLAQVTVAEIPRTLLPLMAAAAAELTDQLGLGWRVTADEAPVALLRMISRAAITDPSAGGPFTIALLDALMDEFPRLAAPAGIGRRSS